MTHWGDGKDTTDTSKIWNIGESPTVKEEEVGEVEEELTKKSKKKSKPLPEESVIDTGMQPEGAETPSPPADLEENTNVETNALKEAMENAPEDAPNGPQNTNLDTVGDIKPNP